MTRSPAGRSLSALIFLENAVPAETLHFDNIWNYLMHKNGNFLFKVPFRGGWAALKLYFGSRGWWRCVAKSFNNYLQDQSSFMPRARRAAELRAMNLWREAGFRVFRTYEDVTVAGLPEGGHMLFEYVEGTRFVDWFADPSVPLEEKRAMWRRYLADAGRRHALCLERQEPAFIHENGDLKHVLIVPGETDLLYFDFEVLYRTPSRSRRHIAREMLGFLRSLGKSVGEKDFPLFIEDTRLHYPHPDLLRECYRIIYCHPNPLHRFGRWCQRTFSARARRPLSLQTIAGFFREG